MIWSVYLAAKHGKHHAWKDFKANSAQNEQLLLTYLLAASINDEASFATKAIT
jgi:hypothetical protein